MRPLLVEKCWPCHGDAERPKGGLRLTSRPSILKGGDSGAAAVAGDPAGSLLIQAIRYEHEPKMPPKGKLTDREIEVLSRWVAMGLPWPETQGGDRRPRRSRTPTPDSPNAQRRFWSFQPVKAVAVPAVRDASRARSPIDRFLLADLEKNGLAPAAPADRRTLIRRATFDLIGLPPTPEEIDAFLADDSPEAFARVVDRLLASPRYGERWGRHWLDVVRYADARDLIQLPAESDFREAWRYRDWVVDAFNRDLPYAEFVRYQIAGDLLPPPRPGGINKDGLVATGLLAIADFVPGDVDKDQMIADYVNDQIDVVGRAFLGLSVACARCHDHKFDPISTEDYYALAGIFFSTRLIPGPVPGNTPLVRVPLLSPDELATVAGAGRRRQAAAGRARAAAARRGRPRLSSPSLRRSITGQDRARISWRPANTGDARGRDGEALAGRAGQAAAGFDEELLAGCVDYLGRVAAQPSIDRHPTAARRGGRNAGRLGAREGRGGARSTSARRAGRAQARPSPPARRTNMPWHAPCLIRLRADDPHLVTDRDGRVMLWPNRAGLPADARPVSPRRRPGEDERHDQRPRQGRAPVRRRVPCWNCRAGARRPAACSSSSGPRTRPSPASACSAGKIPTPASTGSA